MAETLVVGGDEMTLDDAERAFAQAMAAPEPDEPVHPAPSPKAKREPAEAKAEHSKPRVSTTAGTAPKRVRKPAKAAEAAAAKDYTEDLQGVCQLVYGVFAATGSYADAAALKHHGPGMVQAWNAAAQENKMVRSGIEWLTKGGVWGAVMVSTMPFALQLMANHGSVPVEKVAALGVREPEVLAKETERDIQVMASMAEQGAYQGSEN